MHESTPPTSQVPVMSLIIDCVCVCWGCVCMHAFSKFGEKKCVFPTISVNLQSTKFRKTVFICKMKNRILSEPARALARILKLPAIFVGSVSVQNRWHRAPRSNSYACKHACAQVERCICIVNSQGDTFFCWRYIESRSECKCCTFRWYRVPNILFSSAILLPHLMKGKARNCCVF